MKNSVLFGDVPFFLEKLFNESEFPWQVLDALSSYLRRLVLEIPDGFTVFSEGVILGRGVSVSPTATIIGPTIIGENTVIGPGAYVRGNVFIGKNCVVGNSTELKNCVLLDGVAAPHYNYIGDSVLGAGAHLGASAICSNLKSDGSEVVVRSDGVFATGRRKFGSALGDGVEIGCGAVLNPGTVIGRNTTVYPLVSVRGAVGENLIVKDGGICVKKQIKS